MANVLGVALALSPRTHVVARAHAWALGPYDAYGEHLKQARRQGKEGALVDAAKTYTLAYESLPMQDRATELGSDVVAQVAALIEASAPHEPPPTLLETTIALLDRHIEDIAKFAADRDATAFTTTRDDFRAKLSAIRSDEPSSPLPSTPREGSPPLILVGSSPEPDRSSISGSHKLGIGLTTGGSALVVTGVAFMAYGGWLRQRTLDLYDSRRDRCVAEACEDQSEWRDRELRSATGWLAGGSVAAAIGVAALATGIWLMIQRRDRSHRIVWIPDWDRSGTTIFVVGRF